MSYKLKNREKIKEDYEKYKTAVSKLKNNHVKRQYEVLLKDFSNQIDIIEQSHSTFSNGFIDPKANRENVIRLIQIRSELNKLIDD